MRRRRACRRESVPVKLSFACHMVRHDTYNTQNYCFLLKNTQKNLKTFPHEAWQPMSGAFCASDRLLLRGLMLCPVVLSCLVLSSRFIVMSGCFVVVWIRSVDSVCGFGLWIRSVDSVCGFGLWIRSVDFVECNILIVSVVCTITVPRIWDTVII